MGDGLLESKRPREIPAKRRLASVSAAAGSMVAVSSASTKVSGLGAALSAPRLRSGIGADQSTPVTPVPGVYDFCGASPSLPAAEYSWMPPSIAMARVRESGLHASASG